MEVFRAGHGTKAKGGWKSIHATESLTYTVSYGISKEIVDEEITVQAYELTY